MKNYNYITIEKAISNIISNTTWRSDKKANAIALSMRMIKGEGLGITSTIEVMAEDLGISTKTIQRLIPELISIKIIKVDRVLATRSINGYSGKNSKFRFIYFWHLALPHNPAFYLGKSTKTSKLKPKRSSFAKRIAAKRNTAGTIIKNIKTTMRTQKANLTTHEILQLKSLLKSYSNDYRSYSKKLKDLDYTTDLELLIA